MPYVLAFNRSAIEERLTRLAAWLGMPKPGFDAVAKWVLDLRKQIGIPHTLADLGVKKDRLDELSKMAAEDPTAGGNPVPVGAAELKTMFIAAIDGKLA
jgi:alcohol dehydrogenase class IV